MILYLPLIGPLSEWTKFWNLLQSPRFRWFWCLGVFRIFLFSLRKTKEHIDSWTFRDALGAQVGKGKDLMVELREKTGAEGLTWERARPQSENNMAGRRQDKTTREISRFDTLVYGHFANESLSHIPIPLLIRSFRATSISQFANVYKSVRLVWRRLAWRNDRWIQYHRVYLRLAGWLCGMIGQPACQCNFAGSSMFLGFEGMALYVRG